MSTPFSADSAGQDRSTTGIADHAVPTRSAAVGGGIAVLCLLMVGSATGLARWAIVGLGLGMLLATAIVTVDGTGAVRSLAAGVGLIGGVGTAIGVPGSLINAGESAAGGMVAAGVLVGLGVARFRLHAIGGGAVSRSIAWLLRVIVVLAVLTVLTAVVGLDVAWLATVIATGPLGTLVSPDGSAAAGISFLAVSWIAFAGVWLVVASLPPPEVVPPSRRLAFRRWRSGVLRLAGVLLGGGSVIVASLYLLGVELGVAATLVDSTIRPIVESPFLRATLIQLFVTSAIVAGLLAVMRTVGVSLAYRKPGWIASTVAIAIVVAIGAIVGGHLAAGRISTHSVDIVSQVVGWPAVWMVGGLLATCGVALVLMALPALTGSGLLPAATAGPRLAVSGLLGAVLVAGLESSSVSILLIGTVGAIIVWDVTEYGVGQSDDVGATPAHRDGELVHASASVLVGALAVVGVLLISRVVSAIHVSQGGVILVVVLTTLATIVLVFLIRD